MASVGRVLRTMSRKTADGLLYEVISLHPHLQKMTYSIGLPEEDTSKGGYRRLTEALEYDGWRIRGNEWASKEDMTEISGLVSAMSRGSAFAQVYRDMITHGSQTAINFTLENFLERVNRIDGRDWESHIMFLLTGFGFTGRETPYQESVAKKSKEMALPE